MRGRWASSARSAWSRATSAARPTRCRCTSRSSTTTTSSPRPSRSPPWSSSTSSSDARSRRTGKPEMSIEVRNVTKRFGDLAVCDNLSLDVPAGELVALLGPPGSGQTTLLRIIAGLEVPDSGSVLFHGEDATNTEVRDRNVGFVFQHYALFGHMTIAENVAFGLRVRPRAIRPSEREIKAKVADLLKLVQLDWIADRHPHQLSGGQRQRIALARALAGRANGTALDGPRGARAQGAAAGGAVRRARRQGAQGAAPLAAPPARRDARHQRVRHARPGRSD